MKIVLTGSLGHINRPLAKLLLTEGHQVTIISSTINRKTEIESLGATAAIGKLEDLDFLSKTFYGADIVYAMVPTGVFEKSFDWILQSTSFQAENFVKAVENVGVKNLIVLSTVGADLPSGNGLLEYGFRIEKIYQQLSSNVAIKIMRPVGFYYNLLGFIPMIKKEGIISSNYGGDTIKPWVSPVDIAEAIASAVKNGFEGRSVQYIASEEISCNSIASILGATIGKPDLKWQLISAADITKRLLQTGIHDSIVDKLVEMNTKMEDGSIYVDYFQNRPVLGNFKMVDYAKEFSKAYFDQAAKS